MTDEQLSALLRLKRHETPPPGYFDRLLADVHRRQREELLQRPLWKIALERFQTFFGEHSMSPLSYAGAVASVLVAGALGMAFMTGQTGGPSGGAIATTATAPVEPRMELAIAPAEEPPGVDRRLAEIWSAPQADRTRVSQPLRAPRYVIDAQPVSYERPYSF